MALEGCITISLQTSSGRVDQVMINSSRPVHASKVFHGKTVAETLKMLPMLFSICGTAQACAGVRACEQALGMTAPTGIEAVRDSLVKMETLREHLWRIALDWPIFISETAEKNVITDILMLQRDYRHVLTRDTDPFVLHTQEAHYDAEQLHSVAHQILTLLEQAVFAISPAQWLAIHSPEQLEQWAASAQTMSARMLCWVMQKGWNTIGACQIETLPVLDRVLLNKALADDEFVRQPQWLNKCCETTSNTRIDTPLLQQMRHQHDNGLLVRLVARLTEIAQLSDALLSERMTGNRQYNDVIEKPLSIKQTGIGQVAAARGHLVHRVCLQDEQIMNYQILAPTEWNFHPQGVVARSLACVQGDEAQMEQQARLLINAIDPCVGYELSIKR